MSRGPWRIVVYCGPDNLAAAELLAVSLPDPPVWAKAPVVAVCEAGDGEHSIVYARCGSVWVQANNDHSALDAIDLFQSLQPARGA